MYKRAAAFWPLFLLLVSCVPAGRSGRSARRRSRTEPPAQRVVLTLDDTWFDLETRGLGSELSDAALEAGIRLAEAGRVELDEAVVGELRAFVEKPEFKDLGGRRGRGRVVLSLGDAPGAIAALRKGLAAVNRAIETRSENLSKARSPGYKRLLPGAPGGAEARDMSPGRLVYSGRWNDLAIRDVPGGVGASFFRVRRKDGAVVYTRAAVLRLTSDGRVALASGLELVPSLSAVPRLPEAISIDTRGRVRADIRGELPMGLGRLALARFPNPGGLRLGADGHFEATEAAGAPEVGGPGQGDFPQVLMGFRELSNVRPAEEAVAVVDLLRLRRILVAVMARVSRGGPSGASGSPEPSDEESEETKPDEPEKPDAPEGAPPPEAKAEGREE